MIQNGSGRSNKLETLMQQAKDALASSEWFDAERFAERAMTACRARSDWPAMIELSELLKMARSSRRGSSMVKGSVRILDCDLPEDMEFSSGRYLVQPPRVGADARRVRLQCLEQDIPVLVLCREPTTSLGQIPIVAIAPGTTIRTRVDAPSNEKKPAMNWFQSSLEALGQAAIDTIDPEQAIERRIDAILGCLDAVPDHDGLHDILMEACREAIGDS